MMRCLPFIGLALLLLAPVGAAQEPGFMAFSVDAADAAAKEFAVGQTTPIDFQVTVGCDLILQAAGELVVDVATDLPPEWGAGTSAVTFSPDPGCIEGFGATTQSGSLDVSPTMDAIALMPREFAITATSGSNSDSLTHPGSWVAYIPEHTLTPSITFPYEFTEEDAGALEFTLDLYVGANSDTMVMFENIDAAGSVSGLAYQYYYPTQGDFVRNKSMSLAWTPPTGDWVSDNITFMSYSHCLSDPPCDAAVHKTTDVEYVWRIDNHMAHHESGGDEKESPGPAIGIVLVALAAIVVAARRR